MLKGYTMRQLFVKGEVLNCHEHVDCLSCLVNITNDGYHVCQNTFYVQDEEDLEEKFLAFIESHEFQTKLREES